MRSLYYVPMFHMVDEAKEVRESLRTFLKREQVPELIINEIFAEIDSIFCAYWETILERFDKEIKDHQNLFIYLEAIFEENKVRAKEAIFDETRHKTPLYSLLRNLLSRGAILQTTENKELYENSIKSLTDGKIPKEGSEKELKILRDRFIVRQIDTTFPDNSTGILFIGAGHQVNKILEELERNKKLQFSLKLIYLMTKEELQKWEEDFEEKWEEIVDKVVKIERGN